MRKATLCLYKNEKLLKKYENINIISKDNRHSLIIDDTKTIISKDNIIRENNEYRFELDITNKKATYLLKDKNAMFDIDVERISYNNEKNITIIDYKISSDNENTKIELIMNGE